MYYTCSENKGADQLRSDCEADLRLCFRICKLLVFSNVIVVKKRYVEYFAVLCGSKTTNKSFDPPHGKPDYCLYENKRADQLCSNCTADQRLCFRYRESTIPPLLISEISSF